MERAFIIKKESEYYRILNIYEQYMDERNKVVNDFFNKLLHAIAFKKDMQEEIIEQLDYIEDKTNAILEIVKKNAR